MTYQTDNLTWDQVPLEVRRLIRQAREDTSKAAEVAVSDVLGPPAEVLGFKEGPLNSWFGGPRPLASTLAGGAIGAGAGYGAGWLAEHLLPDQLLQKQRLRKTLALLGGALGAVPGAYQAVDNWSQNKGVLDRWPPPAGPAGQPGMLEQSEQFWHNRLRGLDKSAQMPATMAADFKPYVDRDMLHGVIWRDGGISQQLAAATDGLLTAASELRDGARFISPFDVARITAGMGTGLVSGLMVGKTLGALTGLSPSAQKTLQHAGVVAGLVANVVPRAFGR